MISLKLSERPRPRQFVHDDDFPFAPRERGAIAGGGTHLHLSCHARILWQFIQYCEFPPLGQIRPRRGALLLKPHVLNPVHSLCAPVCSPVSPEDRCGRIRASKQWHTHTPVTVNGFEDAGNRGLYFLVWSQGIRRMFSKHLLRIVASFVCGGLIGGGVPLAMIYGAAVAAGAGPTFREIAPFIGWSSAAGGFSSAVSTLLIRWRPAATWPIVAVPASLLAVGVLATTISAISSLSRTAMPWDDDKGGPFVACACLVFLMVPAFLGGLCGRRLARMF